MYVQYNILRHNKKLPLGKNLVRIKQDQQSVRLTVILGCKILAPFIFVRKLLAIVIGVPKTFSLIINSFEIVIFSRLSTQNLPPESSASYQAMSSSSLSPEKSPAKSSDFSSLPENALSSLATIFSSLYSMIKKTFYECMPSYSPSEFYSVMSDLLKKNPLEAGVAGLLILLILWLSISLYRCKYCRRRC